MHACGDRQDMRLLGGLQATSPSISLTMFVATLAIIGTPLTSGSSPRDPLPALAAPSATVSKIVNGTGLARATLTAFYMCRMMIIAFDGTGAPRYHDPDKVADEHGHDDHGHGHDDPNALVRAPAST